MAIGLKFAQEEDDYLRSHVGILRLSRIAHRLQRPYEAVKLRCIALGIISPKNCKESRFCSDDEIEYNLLVSGCTEDEIKQLRGTKIVTVVSGNYSGNEA